MIKSLRKTSMVTWVLINIWSLWALGTATVAQFSIEMEAHTLRVINLAASALNNREFLQKFPEFKDLAGYDEIKRALHVISAHDRAKQDDDILKDLVRFHGVRCGNLPDLAKTECLGAIDRLNSRDAEYMKTALKDVGYVNADGSLTAKGKLVQSLEKAVDWGDRYWASAGEVSKEFGTTMEKGSEFVDSQILPKLSGEERSIVQKSSDILRHLENSPSFNYAEITKGFTENEIHILRNNLDRRHLPIGKLQAQVRADLIAKHNFGRGLRGTISKWLTAGKTSTRNKSAAKGAAKTIGRVSAAFAVVPAVTEVVTEDANYFDALVRNALPGSETGESELSSLYKEGNGNYENLKLLSLNDRQRLYTNQESFYKLRKRFSQVLPFVKKLSCGTNGNNKHTVEFDFGKKAGIQHLQMWVSNRRYGMYEFLNVRPEDRKSIPVARADLIRESLKVDECCRKSLSCAREVNEIALKADGKSQPTLLQIPNLANVGFR